MTAKNIKMRTIIVQRRFIEEQLERICELTGKVGMIDFPFCGEIYPENIKYLNDKGFEVIKTIAASPELKGRPFYLIYPSDEIILTDEEMKLAEDGNLDLAHDDETHEKYGIYNFG